MFLRALCLVLCLGGISQLGSGAWIYLKAGAAQWLIARAWQGARQARPWPWADTWPVARLRVPGSGGALHVLQDSGGQGLAFGPVLLDHPSPEVVPGPLVIAGHRDTHFDFLESLESGDIFYLQLKGLPEQAYAVLEARVVDSSHETLLATGEHLLLVTCYPFNSLVAGSRLRYVVNAVPYFIPNPSQSISLLPSNGLNPGA